MDRTRFAVIGVGGFGMKRVQSIVRSDSARLSYIVDIDTETAAAVGKEAGAEHVSFEDLLEKKDVDVCIVSVPNKLHMELAVRLLRSGKDVWCEKPMSTDVSSAKKMLTTSLETERFLKVGSNVRYFPNVLKAASLLRRGFVGRPWFFRGWIGNEGGHLSKKWYSEDDAGGGTLLDNGIHLIDLMRHMVGEIVECDWCRSLTVKWYGMKAEDNAFAAYRLARGEAALLQSSWTERSGYMYFEIHGSDGFVSADSRWSKAILTYSKGGGQLRTEDLTGTTKLSYDMELEQFIKDYRKGIHPRPTSYDGYRAVKAVINSYETEASGRPVPAFDKLDRGLLSRFAKTFKVDESV